MKQVLKKHTLKEPIEIKAEKSDGVMATITEVEVVKPKGKHFKAMGRVKTEEEKMLAFIGACTGVPPSGMDEMDIEDIAELQGVLQPFFDKFLEIGKPSSAT